ncbi:crossover junction endodeoxyribonuclease RuvC [Nitrospina sp. 32_T5]|uniref:crossover junction endodeoxyribonuclease RuvC n=1 Tax=unclassified Nitrospina TaxID=2638683 RepID=UPI003F9585D3
MRVLGIDPGSNCTGYGIVESDRNTLKSIHWGSIKSKSRTPFPERLKAIYDDLTRVIDEYKPEVVAIEDLFFAVNAQSTIKLGQTRGVALLAAVNASLTVAEYTPLEVKLSIVGYGRADKNQVRDMVTTLLRLKSKPEPLDASDALAVAICHLHNHGTSNRLKEALSSRR